MCHGQILSILDDKLYDLYCETNSSKELRESLESLDKKYRKEDTGDEKYVVGEHFDFKMIKEKYVNDQAHDNFTRDFN